MEVAVYQAVLPLLRPIPTTFVRPERLNEAVGLDLVLAIETFQRTGSFKFRAAAMVVTNVPNEHILCASSGNFGQAIAYACKLAGKRCTVVMPATAAQVKIDAVRANSAHVDLIDTRVSRREDRVLELAMRYPDAYIASPFDDPLVVEGNASLGEEIAKSGFDFNAVIAPVGGGGLASGLSVGLQRAGSKAEIIGAEPLLANDAARSVKAGRLLQNEGEPLTMADGARTRSMGVVNWEILRMRMKRVIEVPESGIADAVRKLFFLANVKAEPTSGLSLAAAIQGRKGFLGQTICCVITGGNVDAALYAKLLTEG